MLSTQDVQNCNECAFWHPLDDRRSRGECRIRLAEPRLNEKATSSRRRWPQTDPLDTGCKRGRIHVESLPTACVSCKWWLQTGAADGRRFGQCRGGSNEYVGSTEKAPAGAKWPTAPEDLWCGDGEAIPPKEED